MRAAVATTTSGRERHRETLTCGCDPCDTRRGYVAAVAPIVELGFAPPRLSRCAYERVEPGDQEGMHVKGSQKPKKLGKKPAQKTLKERRTEKRAAAKQASRSLDA